MLQLLTRRHYVYVVDGMFT